MSCIEPSSIELEYVLQEIDDLLDLCEILA